MKTLIDFIKIVVIALIIGLLLGLPFVNMTDAARAFLFSA